QRCILQRLAPQHVDIDMRGQCPDRVVRAAAAIDRDVRLLAATDFRISPAGPVKLALMVERRRFGPGSAQQGDVLARSAIAGLMAGPVPVFGLLRVAAAVMICTASRPWLSWSNVASLRAATGGATNPGRCANRKPRRSVTDAACAPTRKPSGASEK